MRNRKPDHFKLEKRMRSSEGFTLLEVLVAVAIFSVGLLALAGIQTRSITANATAHRITTGAALAQGALEDLLARDSSDPLFDVAAVNAVYDLDPQTPATTQTIEGVTYNATFSITPNTPVTNVAQVSVTITDISVAGGGRTFTLLSFKRSAA